MVVVQHAAVGRVRGRVRDLRSHGKACHEVGRVADVTEHAGESRREVVLCEQRTHPPSTGASGGGETSVQPWDAFHQRIGSIRMRRHSFHNVLVRADRGAHTGAPHRRAERCTFPERSVASAPVT